MHVLQPVQPLQRVVQEQAQQRQQDDALRGAEVAAVDARGEDQDGQHAPAVRVVLGRVGLRRSAPAGGRAASAPSRGWTAISSAASRISPGTIALNALGAASSSEPPVRPPAIP